VKEKNISYSSSSSSSSGNGFAFSVPREKKIPDPIL
jgi:hypothetical protein